MQPEIKVLLIEDDEDDFVITRKLLSRIDGTKYQLDWVTDYDAGLEAALKCEHDICLLDYRLGERTGLELVREFFKKDSKMPIILLTGQGDHEIDLEAAKAGASDYMVKGQITSSLLERSIRYSIERKKIEQARDSALELAIREQESRQQAEQANRLKDEFLAMLSHELRTPLNAILGWSQLLQTRNLGEKVNKALAAIERNALAQNHLIDDLLDVSRIVTGKLRLNVQVVDLSGVITAAVDTARPSAEARNIRLQTLLDPHTGPISCDSDRLQQVVWNLLSNAVKFTPKNGRVQVRLERVNSHVEIVISDTGKGIEPEFLPYVFDKFRQFDGSMTRRHGGLGLGLAIVRQLVELHGGTVSVSSAGEGQGTTFTVSLPLLPVRTEPPSDVTRVHPAAEMGVPLDC
ncbi:MAG TPA: hybrid sensor histidine kinase/response regulator [Pyrinomonadaceae bacterium]|nr:hybrid sensor histidine kinase/response regulator [Pyrinomonadaceae bacterium]